MVEIHHRRSRRVLLQVHAETLERVNLAGEYLIHADLRGTNLTSASLLFANLSGADLSDANLSGANLRGANLTEADLSGVDFANTILAGATLSLTIFARCRNLHRAQGLLQIHHKGPSTLDEETLRASVPYLPDSFLRGVGYTRAEIRQLRQLYPRTSEEEPI